MRTSSPYEMVAVGSAVATILAHARVTGVNHIAPWNAEGRTLARDVVAEAPIPGDRRAAVDGYAIRTGDPGPRQLLPRELVAGQAMDLTLEPGQAVRIMTGSVVPTGADAVVMVEACSEDAGRVRIDREPTAGANIHQIGDDIAVGDRVVRAGSVLGAIEIGLLAALGQTDVAVYRRPRVAVLSTGDELSEPWETPGPGGVRDSNRYALLAAIREAGAEVVWHGSAGDDSEQLAAIARSALARADVLITSGGVSMGTRDLVKPLLGSLGTVLFGRVNMKPGKPVTVATVNEKLIIALPGYPVSSLVTFEVLARPALLKMSGRTRIFRPRVDVELAHDIRPDRSRPAYHRAVVSWHEGRLVAQDTGSQGSSRLLSMRGANALLEIAPADHAVPAGQRAPALLTGEIANDIG